MGAPVSLFFPFSSLIDKSPKLETPKKRASRERERVGDPIRENREFEVRSHFAPQPSTHNLRRLKLVTLLLSPVAESGTS